MADGVVEDVEIFCNVVGLYSTLAIGAITIGPVISTRAPPAISRMTPAAISSDSLTTQQVCVASIVLVVTTIGTWLPAGPCGPVAPVAPAAPCGPCVPGMPLRPSSARRAKIFVMVPPPVPDPNRKPLVSLTDPLSVGRIDASVAPTFSRVASVASIQMTK